MAHNADDQPKEEHDEKQVSSDKGVKRRPDDDLMELEDDSDGEEEGDPTDYYDYEEEELAGMEDTTVASRPVPTRFAPMSDSALIRERQDREYAESLQKDQAKRLAALAKAEEKRLVHFYNNHFSIYLIADGYFRERQEAEKNRRAELAAQLPEEPRAESSFTITVRARLSTGQMVGRLFPTESKLHSVLTWISSLGFSQGSVLAPDGSDVSYSTPYPE